MTKEQYLEIASKRYDELRGLNQLTDFYDYESEFVKIWKKFGNEILETNLSSLVADKRKKKPHYSRLHNNKQ